MKTLAFILCLFTLNTLLAQLEKDIKIKMSYKNGFRPFPRSFPLTITTEDSLRFKKKKNISNYIIKEISVFLEYTKYQDFKKGLIDNRKFNQILQYYNIDSTKVFKGSLRSKVYCLVGQTAENKRSIIFDQNGDFDFTNDFEYIIDYPNKLLAYNADGFYNRIDVIKFVESLPPVKVSVECIYNNSKYAKDILLKPVPYNTSIDYENNLEKEFPLQVLFDEHLEGKFTINNNSYYIALNNMGFPYLGYLGKDLWNIMLRKENEDFPLVKPGENLFKFKDTLYIEDNKYLVSSISLYGENVILKYHGKKVKEFGISKGNFLVDFTGISIFSEVINSKEFNNKFLLLDFWGTWCGPCIKMLPKMKELHNKIDPAKIELISIAREYDLDSEKFKQFLKTNDIHWTQILETNDTKNKLSEKFDIQVYPTFFLIDKDRKIILNGNTEAELDRIVNYISNNIH